MEEKNNSSEKKEETINVYSMIFPVVLPNGSRGITFGVFENTTYLKAAFSQVCDVMIPGDDIIKVGMIQMTKKRYEEVIGLLAQEQGWRPHEVLKGGD